MHSHTYEISFPGETPRDAGRYAAELTDFIQGRAANIKVERKRTNEKTMDLGSVVHIIVDAAAITTLAGGVADWLRLRKSAKITISHNGDLILENVSSEEATRVALERTGVRDDADHSSEQ